MHAADSKSGARFERVAIDRERYVVKYLSRDDDWIIRATGDPAYRPLLVWETGLVDLTPDCIDHAYVGAARDGAGAAPSPLVRSLEMLPASFLHGDWKMGNLGRHADGRTILIDWANPGAGAGVTELTWYLALNRARLPVGHSKEDAIDAYRGALERLGVDTAPWWERALGLAFVGALVQFGWEKPLGDTDELAWWEERALAGATYLEARP